MSEGNLPISRVIPGILEQTQSVTSGTKPEAGEQGAFSDMFTKMIGSVNELQAKAGKAQQALMAGEPVELHEVMIKAEKSGLAMDLLLEVRNRLIDGYKEIMRMPM